MNLYRNSFVILALLAGTALAANTYRYVDDQGVTHIGYSVPPEFVIHGYEVLNDKGRVVEVVLPKSELDARAAKTLQEADARQKIEAQREADAKLLRFYSSTQDIVRVRDRKIAEFDNFIQIQERNIAGYQEKIKALQAQAAGLERRGRAIPDTILETLGTLKDNVAEAEETIAAKQAEKVEVHEIYQKDITRLEFLMKSQEETEASVTNAKAEP